VKPLRPSGIPLKKFFLSVGTIEPRKNHITLILAYLKAKETFKNLPELLILGRKGWGDDRLYKDLKSGKYAHQGVLYLENASMEELTYCYSKALFCTLPSLHEGFGLPIIEALSYGKISIASDIPIFREICKECEFVAPLDTKLWSEAIIKFSRRKKQPGTSFNKRLWSWRGRAVLLSNIMDSLTNHK
jgi:glycosyltransferase involved in cell wall biosynthesis